MKNEGFKVFKRRQARRDPDVPRVTIQRNGKLAMNSAAFEILEKPDFVVFLYDPGRRAIGLKAVEQNVSDAYPVRQRQPYLSYRISATSFLRHAGISYGSQTMRFRPHMEGDTLVIELGGELEEKNDEKAPGPNSLKSPLKGGTLSFSFSFSPPCGERAQSAE